MSKITPEMSQALHSFIGKHDGGSKMISSNGDGKSATFEKPEATKAAAGSNGNGKTDVVINLDDTEFGKYQ